MVHGTNMMDSSIPACENIANSIFRKQENAWMSPVTTRNRIDMYGNLLCHVPLHKTEWTVQKWSTWFTPATILSTVSFCLYRCSQRKVFEKRSFQKLPSPLAAGNQIGAPVQYAVVHNYGQFTTPHSLGWPVVREEVLHVPTSHSPKW